MANFIAYSKFDIRSLDFNWYYQNLVKLGLAEDANLVVDGITYPDVVTIQAKNGSTNLELDFLGHNVTLDGNGNINGGIANFIAEVDLNTKAVRWGMFGIQADAESLYDSFGTVSNQDEVSILLGALGGNDEIILSAFDDFMNAWFGNDLIFGGGGNDFIDASAGSDTAFYSGDRSEYSVSFDRATERFTVTDLVAGRDGTDTLLSVEYLSFADQLFDLANLVYNKNPVFSVPSQSVVTDEETAVIVLVSATDPNGDPISYSISNPSRSGTVSGSNGVYTYVPANGFNGIDSFVVAANDGRGGITNQTITVTVSSVNDAPVNQVTGPLQINEDVNLSFDPFLNKLSVEDLDSPIVTVTLSVTHGILTVQNPGPAAEITGKDTPVMTISGLPHVVSAVLYNSGLRFIPEVDYSGPALLTMVSNDGPGGVGGRSDTDFIPITINAVNDKPAFADFQAVTAPTGKTVQISAVAFDPDDAVLSYEASPPLHGTISGGTGGIFSYTAVKGYLGPDSFKIFVSDGRGSPIGQTVNVMVTPAPATDINSRPVADDDGPYAAVEDDLLIVAAPQGVIAGDSDVDGGTLTAVLVSTTPNGRLMLSADGSFTYLPNANFNGTDSFVYKARDSAGALSLEQIVVIQIGARDDAPHAVDDSLSTPFQTTLVIPAATLVANDTDIDSTKLTVTSVQVQGSLNGNLSLNAGVITFQPYSFYSGVTSFSYTVTDDLGATDEAKVTVLVGPPGNNAPAFAAPSQAISAAAGTPANIAVAATDANGDSLTYTIGVAAKGTATIAGNAITYTPKAFASGTDSLIVTASDGKAGIATQTINITIAAAALPPSAFQLISVTGKVIIGGNGSIAGTNGVDDVSLLHGAITLDGSFNRGGDILRLEGNASSNFINRSGTSTAIITDNDALRVAVPLGTAGLTAVFDDGTRTLLFDGANAKIGAQTFGTDSLAITAPSQGSAPPTTGAAGVRDILVMAGVALQPGQAAHVTIGGKIGIAGTNGTDVIAIADAGGTFVFDGSFNRGGDVIVLGGNAASYSATRQGSSTMLISTTDEQLTIPIGTVGLTLRFADGDRTLVFSNGKYLVGGQEIIGTVPNQLEFLVTGGNAPQPPAGDMVGGGVLGDSADVIDIMPLPPSFTLDHHSAMTMLSGNFAVFA